MLKNHIQICYVTHKSLNYLWNRLPRRDLTYCTDTDRYDSCACRSVSDSPCRVCTSCMRAIYIRTYMQQTGNLDQFSPKSHRLKFDQCVQPYPRRDSGKKKSATDFLSSCWYGVVRPSSSSSTMVYTLRLTKRVQNKRTRREWPPSEPYGD